MSQASDLVQDAELQTSFHAQFIVHVHTETGQTAEERAVRREEHWKREKYIGGGSYGSVWLEKCIKGQRDLELRAVKEVTKSPQASKKVDYARELEAISKFSHRKYERCFVKSYGWYENENAIFIAMEYFELGDLHHLLFSVPPLPEQDAQQIVFQVLEGLQFMHSNGYAHRDLKPGNILVRSKPPDPWWIKLGDFGISKRAADSVAASSTVKGTLRYMAPELLDFVKPGPGLESTKAQAADMWALGEIAFQMLTKEPTFKSMNLLMLYVRSPKSFPVDALRSRNVDGTGIDFIQNVMQPKPRDRMTAIKALRHGWVRTSSAQTLANASVATDGSTAADIVSLPPLEQSMSAPSGRWSTVSMEPPTLRPARSITDFFTRKPGPPTATISLPKSNETVVVLGSPKKSISSSTSQMAENGVSVPPDSRSQTVVGNSDHEKIPDKKRKPASTSTAKYYTVKGGSEFAIETSSAHGIWCCGKAHNTMLSNAFNSTKKPIFLILSVVGSRQFCGVAQMKSAWTRKITTEHWETVGWDGGFEVEWLSFKTIEFDDVKHLLHKEETGVSITKGRFVLEICASSGMEMMRRFGVADKVPPMPPAQPLPASMVSQGSSDLNSLGSLGVSGLGLGAEVDTSFGDDFELLPYVDGVESEDHSQPATTSSVLSVGDKRARDEEMDDESDNDRRKRA